MKSGGWRIDSSRYILYKFFNSLFLGLNVGTIFTIYSPLDPSIYSLGGIVLALGMLAIARIYEKIMNIGYFFFISLFVEAVVLVMVTIYLLHPYGYMTALLIYSGYQLTFVFGAYLVRAETLALSDDTLLKSVDTYKQLGYLMGMSISWLLYKGMEYYGIEKPAEKVYLLHYALFTTELVIIVLLKAGFRKEKIHKE